MMVKQFIKYQFEYWPLIWMFHSRALNNKNNKINSINDMAMTGHVSIHHRKLHILAIKMFQIKNNNFRRISR